ncbi:MAG TPA: hypothetical protein VFV99_22540, partial [Kofleriaceae bacterium]|nr:hypothetical protein [Kofleriaceae bacterium]
LPDAELYKPYVLDGTTFYAGDASWQWTVTSDNPCDAVFLTTTTKGPTYDLAGGVTSTITLTPRLTGDYTLHAMVTPTSGPAFQCDMVVHAGLPGLRVEQCSDKSSTADLDLHLHRPGTTTNWETTPDDCYYMNCKADAVAIANWGYANSPIAACQDSPTGTQWQTVGSCRNPRLEVDSIMNDGVPEIAVVDTPIDSATYRVAVRYYQGTVTAHPIVTINCGGKRAAAYGVAPDQVTGFNQSGPTGQIWRVADVTTTVTNGVTDCTVTPLHPPGQISGYWVQSNSLAY